MNILASFCAFGGEPVSIFSVVAPHPNSGLDILGIRQSRAYTTKKPIDKQTGQPVEMSLILDVNIGNYEMLFGADRLREGIEAYSYLTSTKQCIIAPSLGQYDVRSMIEKTAIRDSGRQEYEIFDEFNNGGAAVLATCLFYKNFMDSTKAINMTQNLMDMMMTL